MLFQLIMKLQRKWCMLIFVFQVFFEIGSSCVTYEASYVVEVTLRIVAEAFKGAGFVSRPSIFFFERSIVEFY